MASANHPVTEMWLGDTDPAAALGDVLYVNTATGEMKVRGDAGGALVTIHDPAAITDHGALGGLADDDHPQYQKESEKGAASGYASLDASTLLLRAEQTAGPDRVYRNAGTPEGAVTAAVGSLCLDTTNGAVYEKRTGAGNTGWLRLVPTDDSRMTDARTPTAHKTSHQDGGSDEMNVAGLSGLLADGQVAVTIRTTTGPTDLAVGAVADGEYLKRTGATTVSGNPRTDAAALYAKAREATVTPDTVFATDYMILCDTGAAGADQVESLPAASGSGRMLVIKKWTAGFNVIITPSGGDTIDGAAGTLTITTLNQSYTLHDVAVGEWAIA